MHPSNAVLYAYRLTWIGVLVMLFAFRFDFHTGFTSLVRFGEGWEDHRVPELKGLSYRIIPGQRGYDGQFYAQLALHPRLTDPELAQSMDSVHYRARRILIPILSFILGLGNAAAVLQIFAAINVVCWCLLGWQLLRWLPPTSWNNFGRWFFCVCSAGVLASLRGALTDLPSLCLLLFAIRCWEEKAFVSSTLVLAATGLARETMLLGGLFLVDGKGWRRSFFLGLASCVPLVAWTLYLHHLFPLGDRSDLNFSPPFLEFFRAGHEAWSCLANGLEDRGRYTFRLFALLGFAVQAGVFCFRFQPNNLWWRTGLPFLLLLPFLGAPVWEGYWAVCRSVLPLTVAFNLLLPGNRWFWPLLLMANLPTTLHALFRVAF